MALDKITPNDLSLQIAGMDAPFALLGKERYFGPADWAWQFLRLKGTYQKDYANALRENNADDEFPEGSFEVLDKFADRKIRTNEVTCREKYGLSTWLAPSCDRLPMREKTESWFYPLMQAIDSQERICDGSIIPMEGVFSYYYLSGPGQYDKRRAPASGRQFSMESSSNVWFAIDCSVFPDAQMKAVETLSKAYRDRFLEMKQKPPSSVPSTLGAIPLKECPRFHVEEFNTASALVEKVDPCLVWYAICIDTLGPLKEQIKKHLTELRGIHRRLVESNLAKQAIRERFHNELIGPRDEGGNQLSDGNFLKALVICEQLAQGGLDESEMMEFLCKHSIPSEAARPTLGSIRDEWATGLERRLAAYREQARQFVEMGYLWLIHAQKP